MRHIYAAFRVLTWHGAILLITILSFNTAKAQTYATIPYNIGFETGFDPSWINTSTPTTGEINTFMAIYSTSWGNALPKAGNYFMGMHHPSAGGGAYCTNEAKLHLNLSGKNQVHLDFWWAEWNDETEPQDGVYISDNGGVSYSKVLDLPGASFTDLQWYHFDINLDSALVALSMSYTANFIVKFQQYDNYYFNGGNDGHMYDEINVYSICAPTASFTHTSGTAPYSVDFTNTSTDTSNIFWDFGDGNTSTLVSPTHIYSGTGSYNVCVASTKTCGTDTFCTTIDICDPLNAGFTANITNLAVQFTNTSADTSNVLWTFGNGQSSTLANPQYTYLADGFYNVCMTVTNACESEKFCDTVKACSAINPDFTMLFGSTLRDVSFTYSGTGPSVKSYLWEFGDGDTSSQQNTAHTYATNGLYTVKLTVLNQCGSVYSISKTIDAYNGIAVLNANNVQIYPNPNSGTFTIDMPGSYLVEMYRTDGKRVYAESYNEPAANGLREINMGDAAPGVYLLNIKTGNSLISKKVFIR